MYHFGNSDNDTYMEGLAKLHEMLPTVPLKQRGKALAIYNIIKSRRKAEDVSYLIKKVNRIDTEKQIDLISAEIDAIIEGARPCTESELKATKDFLAEDEQIKPEDNDGKPIDE
jgi:hypothetical protein